MLYQNNESEALDAALRSLDVSKKSEYPTGIGCAWRILGMISAQINQTITVGKKSFNAAECFGNSLQTFTEANIEAEKGRTLREFARYEDKRRNMEKAEAMKREARAIFTKLKMPLEI